MNFSHKLALATAASALFTASTFAATSVTLQAPSKNSVYVSANAGYATLATPDQNLLNAENGVILRDQSHDLGYFGGGVGAGFNRALNNHVLIGAEVGYDYNGQSKYTSTFLDGSDMNLKVTSYDFRFLGTGTYVFNNGVDVFGKVGGARVSQRVKFDYVGYSDSETINEWQPMLAAGLGYSVTKAINLSVEYAHVFGTNANSFNDLVDSDGSLSHTVSVDSVKAGVSYNFAI